MKVNFRFTRPFLLMRLVLIGFLTTAPAQEIVIPDSGLESAIRDTLGKPDGPLTEQDLLTLTNLSALSRNVQSIVGLEAARNLVSLDLEDNRIASLDFPPTLTSLAVLDLSENQFPSLTLPGVLTNLTRLRIEVGALTNLTLPEGLTRVTELRFGFNQLTDLILPADMTNLSVLSVYQNHLTNIFLPTNLKSFSLLDFSGNELTVLELPAGLTKMDFLNVGDNHLTRFIVPADMKNLTFLRLGGNQLTTFTLPAGMTNLFGLFLKSNQLTNLSLPSGLTSLAFLDLSSNELSTVTLPPDMTNLGSFYFAGNPLATLVLSEPLAAGNLAATVADFQNQGIEVITYPLTVQLTFPQQQLIGAFRFGISGPPGVYTIFSSTNLNTWNAQDFVNNPLGDVTFTDVTAQLSSRKFYRAERQTAPANLVFVPANTFTMGSPDSETGRQANEAPQTVVTLAHGFWIGKHEVTQAEYLAVTGENPSGFPGDLNRPVESVSRFAASNYCALLTGQDLAVGRTTPGSRYRLPTEVEWECAARAGSTTQFYYGDDSDLTGLPSYAWFGAHDGVTTPPFR